MPHFHINIGSGRPSGYTKAAVVNTAIDERFAIFSSAVITASEREAISMIDLLLGNPVVKSTIHSTDTHGSTEVIFGIMQLLGVYFAPRIKDVGSLLLYGFKNHKEYEALDYKIVPDHDINKSSLKSIWDAQSGRYSQGCCITQTGKNIGSAVA